MERPDIRTLQEKLAESERRAEDEREISRNFVSAVAHELRTPVTVIRGSLEALCDGIVTEREQVNEYHRQMLAESIYLQRLVTDLLEFSRLQSRSFNIIREPVNIPDVVSDVCRSIRQIVSEKNIELNVSGSGTVYIVNGDYARLRQMLIVLLDNAVKFTGDGGRVSVSQVFENNRLYLRIEDTGCGIRAEELENIFVRFHRSVNTVNRNGTGLGLAIAREIAERHKADISVESVPGEGSTFTVCFREQMTPEELSKYE